MRLTMKSAGGELRLYSVLLWTLTSARETSWGAIRQIYRE